MFETFKEVYLFGSVLEENRVPNDIDILLIYFDGSGEIARDTSHILVSLENLLGMPVDLTVLSLEEERETQFLKRIMPRCLKLK